MKFFSAVNLSLLLEKCSQTNSILAEQPNFFFFTVFNIEVEYPNKLNTLIMSQRSLSRSQSEIVRTEQTDFAGQYDYVFVFKMVKSYNNSGVFEQSDCAKKCIFSMLEAGLEVFPYLSIQQDELLVLVKCSVRSSIYHLI